MLSKIKSISLIGLEGNLIEVQTDISNGIPEFEIVGLPDTSVRESKKRIVSAIKNSKIEFPSKKILINLAPANIKKEGSSFDLPIAIGILISIGILPNLNYNEIVNTVIIGELSLDGKINRTNGIFAMCEEARALGIKRVIIPKANSNEVSIIKGLDIIQAKMLIHKWEKRLGSTLSNEKLIYRIAYDENILFFNKFHYYKDCLEELKDSLDDIDDIYNNESDVMRDRYLGIIATAYRLEITGLFHTKPVVNDEFMKKCYNRNFIRQDKTKDIIKDIGWQMYSYFLKRMFEFQKSIYMQIYMFLQDRNLWR